jgi:thiazole synthase ThiGH ThiG subunit
MLISAIVGSRVLPVQGRLNRHGDRANSEVVGTERVLIKGKWRSVEVRACPVRFSPDQRQIDGARQAYEDWWQALGWVRDGLIEGRMLREVDVTKVMPRSKPWGTNTR